MSYQSRTKVKKNEDIFGSLSVQLKQQMNDIIEVAYSDWPEIIFQLKRFTIMCKKTELKSKLGDCSFLADKSSRIRIFAMESEGPAETLITMMHEVSHHIDHSLRGRSGHDNEFYDIHKKLLFAAMDMGIISQRDVVNSESKAQNRDKLAKMMDEYVPNPIDYKIDMVTIIVYKAYLKKNLLKERGYFWNGLDKAWVIELNEDSLSIELDFLRSLEISDDNIKVIYGNGVVIRQKKVVRLYNVPFESNDVVKSLGYCFEKNKDEKFWKKNIDSDNLSDEEKKVLNEFDGIEIVIL